jgi:hypothetical protein
VFALSSLRLGFQLTHNRTPPTPNPQWRACQRYTDASHRPRTYLHRCIIGCPIYGTEWMQLLLLFHADPNLLFGGFSCLDLTFLEGNYDQWLLLLQ